MKGGIKVKNIMSTSKLRFPEFIDAWEQHKLGDFGEATGGTSIESEFTKSGKFKVISIGSYSEDNVYRDQGIRAVESEKTKKRVLNKGDLTMILNDKTASGNIIGRVLLVDESGAYVYNQRTERIEIDFEKYDSIFIYEMLNAPNIRKKIIEQAQGNTQIYVNWSNISLIEYYVPSLPEQKKIGEFFSNFDKLISLYQHKCDGLKELKRSLLQKMFPKEGEYVPEIRFPGFTDAWEQRKFSEFTYDAGKRNKENLELEPYAVTNDRGFIPQNEAHDEFGYMQNVDRTAYKIVKPHSFAYNPARINVGSIGYYDGKNDVIVSSLYEVFQTADYVDDRFLWHWLKSDNLPKWIGRLQEGSVRLYFYYNKLCECNMMIPSVDEQKKIASFLDTLDNAITLHQRKCDELKELKKGLLQQMFL